MKSLLKAARGDVPCDLLIKGGNIANVLSLEYERADIAVSGGVIVGVGDGYKGREEVDASGCVLMPGMIDGHIHIESTMLSPVSFAELVLPLGTTTVMADPHEIANTCGLAGIEYMWEESRRTPLDAFYAAPSCVPASSFETPYQELGADAMAQCYDKGWCGHLGELMNFPGVIGGDDAVWEKIDGAKGRVREGHAPGLRGKDLCAYLLGGCESDHECITPEEALEKLRRGMWIMMREGATEHGLKSLIEIIRDDESRFGRCMVVSDDLTANYILYNGHLDRKMRMMHDLGVRPLIAAAMLTINPAQFYGLRDRGAIAPGRIADIAMVTSLEECRVLKVWKRGNLAAADGTALFETLPSSGGVRLPQCTAGANLTEDAIKVPAQDKKNIRVIGVMRDSLISGHHVMPPKIEDGFVVSDADRDIVKFAVVEKNRNTGRVATGFARGFGLKRGAIASSVAHDAHNFSCVGVDDTSMVTALNFLARNGGGLVVADGEKIVRSLALPLGGLMSEEPPAVVAESLIDMEREAAIQGASLMHPFMAMSFMSLSVIPNLRLTDQGYIDIQHGGKVEMFV